MIMKEGLVMKLQPASPLRIAAFVGAALLAGCMASTQSRPAPEDEVRLRAQARWNAVVAGDWQKAYNFATPAYREAVDLAGFRGRSASPVTFKSAEVVSVKCEESACEVRMRVGFAPIQRGFPDLSSTLDERWVNEGDEWWRYEKF